MLRTLGAALIGLSSAAMGMSLSAQMHRRLHAVTEFRDALLLMRQKITYYRTPLPQMMHELAEECGGVHAPFFQAAALRLERNRERTAEAVLSGCLREFESGCMPREAMVCCRRLFASLGWMDGANQAEALSRAVSDFDALEQTLRRETARRGRCFCVVGVCGGLAAAIILI